MFVRKKKNKSGSVSIQIIDKVDRKNKILETIGCSSKIEEIELLYQQALRELLNYYGPTLFDKDYEPQISELSNDSIRVIGPEQVFETTELAKIQTG